MNVLGKTIVVTVIICFGFSLARLSAQTGATLEKQAAAAMKNATQFYYGKVSTKGGYLSQYTVDMKYRYGELPARESQIWVQGATPDVGEAYLDAYEATGDTFYLEAADAAARALVRGQLECGGWNYLIDFKAGDIEDWYEHEGHHPDYNEFSHFDGNATFDDATTYGPTMFLLRLYDITSNPVYLGPLEKALDFVLEAQLPLGGWSQRYPLIGTGYDTYYTFNDDVIQNNIDLLFNAYRVLAQKKYLEAAMRGADFIIISQHPGPQYGWGQQYTHDLKLAWGRAFEPPSLSPRCITNVQTLMDTYEITGDRRYLEPILKCLDWLDSVTSPDGTIPNNLEEGTNRPLYAMYEGDSGTYESIKITNDPSKALSGYGWTHKNSTKRERERYASLVSKPWQPKPETVPPTGEEALNQAKALEPNVRRIINTLDDQGRWTDDGRMFTARYCFKNVEEYEGPVMKNGWIRTGTFLRNIRTLSQYVELMKNAGKR